MKAKTHLSQTKSRDGFTLVEMLVVIGMIAALAGISFPVYKSIQKKVEKQKLVMMFNSIERAVVNFETEYNYLPYVGNSYPSTEPSYTANKTDELMTVLVGGYSAANPANFKGITFLEGQLPEGDSAANYKHGLLVNGLGAAQTAVLYTPWGGTYDNFIMDYNNDGYSWQPYASSFGVTTKMQAPVIFFDIGSDDVWVSDYDFCSCRQCDATCLTGRNAGYVNLWK
jgi:prepilin-type N-terminal cleavage/methylation domain-containing protein